MPSEIISLNEIKIPYKQNVITFEFTAFNYIDPANNLYAYKLEGFDKDWQYIGNKREVTYTNLNPGEYLFRVKAANNDGVWNTSGTVLSVIILPPWWKTLVFRILIVLLIIGVSVSFYFFKVRSLRKHKAQLEILVSERTREIEEKNKLLVEKQETVLRQAEYLKETNQQLTVLNATKDKFFSIIAHDLKNPFNSLLGFSEMLSSDFKTLADEKKLQIAETIHVSSDRIYKLLENLLQWAGTQTGNIPYNPEVFDLNDIIDLNHDLVRELLIEKKTSLIKKLPEDAVVFADRNMINTVIRNLLGNAIKFTENGEICISVAIKKSSPGNYHCRFRSGNPL